MSQLPLYDPALDTDSNEPPAKQVGGRFSLLSIPDLRALPAPTWLVRDVIPASAFIVLAGDPGAGKSFVALDLALSLASGIGSWQGHEAKHGSVVYVAGEGVSGYLNRIEAWCAYRVGEPLCAAETAFRLVPQMPHILDRADLAAFTTALLEMEPPPIAVILDTWARALAGTGGDENNTADTSAGVEAMGQIIGATGASVVVVHHFGKDSGKGARGSTALLGGCDVMLSLRSEGGSAVRLASEKMKDAEPLRPLRLRLDKVTLGLDADGQPRTSLRVRSEGRHEMEAALEAERAASESKLLDLFKSKAYVDGATPTEAMAVLEMPRRTFFRAARNLVAAGALKKVKGSRYVQAEPAPETDGKVLAMPSVGTNGNSTP